VDGGSLLQLRRSAPAGRIPEPILARFCWDVLEGLRYLHKVQHVIHRDVKPSNLLFDRTGRAKIADFGVSSQQIQTLACANSWVGTTTYMAPERITGGAYSFDTDLWSLGLSLMECALGRYPYHTPLDGAATLAHNSTTDGPPTCKDIGFFDLLHLITVDGPPRLPSNGYTPQLIDFLDACLQKQPGLRASAADLVRHPYLTHCADLGGVASWVAATFKPRGGP
jgi:serine/threonine protein kinase